MPPWRSRIAWPLALVGCNSLTGLDTLEFDSATASSSSAGHGGAAGAHPAGGGGAGASIYRDAVMADQPVGYWRFSEPLGAISAGDEIGAAPGTYQGSVTLGFPGALASDEDTAAVFDGVDDQVDFGDVHDFAGVSEFSVEAWIAPQLSAINGAVCTKQISAVDGFEFVVTSTPELVFGRELNGIRTTPVVASVPLARFSHVVGTFDGSSLRLYVNGALSGTQGSQVVLPDTRASLTAGNSYGVAEWFTGVIDELAIYDKSLTAERIQAHYDAGVMR